MPTMTRRPIIRTFPDSVLHRDEIASPFGPIQFFSAARHPEVTEGRTQNA
jgi:hypothetical protein